MTWSKFISLLIEVADKYYLFAGLAFLIFYVILSKKIPHKKIQAKFPRGKDYLREIVFSTISIIIFSIVPLVILFSESIKPYSRYYIDISEYGWAYFFLDFPIMLLVHDTYFYWMHRAMHLPRFFKTVHLTHHKSTNPSPWAAYAFHPLEAIAESMVFAIFLFTMPIHKIHLVVFFTFSICYNVYGHLGFEIYPKGFNTHWFGKWMNTSISHNQHHQYFKGNYGLYFTIWDRIMGTLRPDYDSTFDSVKSRIKPQLKESSALIHDQLHEKTTELKPVERPHSYGRF